jgi:hypothetical protein
MIGPPDRRRPATADTARAEGVDGEADETKVARTGLTAILVPASDDRFVALRCRICGAGVVVALSGPVTRARLEHEHECGAADGRLVEWATLPIAGTS